MNVGDRVIIIETNSLFNGQIGTLKFADQFITTVTLDIGGDYHFNPAQVQPYKQSGLKTKMKFISRYNPSSWCIIALQTDNKSWIVLDAWRQDIIGTIFSDMQDFRIHNLDMDEDPLYIHYPHRFSIPDDKPKAHVHTWKTRVLFTSMEEYCTGCDSYRPITKE